MSTATVGLLGVVLGAFVTGGLQLWRDLRADRRKRLAAIRQIYADLRLARSRLGMVQRAGCLRTGERPDTYDLPDSSWLEHGTDAAGLVDPKTWEILISAVMGVRSLNRLFATVRSDAGRVGLALTDEEMTEIRRVSAYIEFTYRRVEALHEGNQPTDCVPPQLIVVAADSTETLAQVITALVPAVPAEWEIATNRTAGATWTEIALPDQHWDSATTRVRETIDKTLPTQIVGHVKVHRRHIQFDGL